MTEQHPQALEHEAQRIKEAYARRQNDTRYSLFNPGALFMLQEVERKLLALLRRQQVQPLATKKILEIGCGTGYWLREFIRWGALPANLHGIDLLVDDVATAQVLCPPGVHIACGNAAQLPFPEAIFDLILQATVFTSVLDPGMKRQLAAEMLRVLKRGGLVLWYDYHVNNPRNPDVRGVKREEILRLFPGCHVALHPVTLAPPIVRTLAPYSWLLCALLSKIPWLCTHYLGVIRKGQEDLNGAG